MAYFQIDEYKDVTVKITQEDVTEADKYIDALLRRIGAKSVPVPVPYEVVRLAVAVAYRNRALLSSTRGINGAEDVYMLKYNVYDKQVRQFESLITLELLEGKKQRKVVAPCITVLRG